MSASERLCGLTLADKWLVTEKLEMKPGSTGSCFSVGYKVRSLEDGQEYFLKAMNLANVFRLGPDLITNLKNAAGDWAFERETYEKCSGLRRIVRIKAYSDVHIDDTLLGNVPYMIFELAECDIRSHLNSNADGAYAWKLRALHNVASAIQALHKRGIAHLDLKPSNALKCGKDIKVGDLGSCVDITRPREGDDAVFPGDPAYIPPELALGLVPDGFNEHRFGTDFYLLGSLGTYLFTKQTMNQHTTRILSSLSPASWGGGYEQALAFFQFAVNSALEEVRKNIDDPEIADATVAILSELCNPDFRKRGLPKGIKELGSTTALQKYVSQLDHLATRAEWSVRKELVERNAATLRA